MSITRLWQTGAESGNSTEFDGMVDGISISALADYTGVYGLRVYKTNGIGYAYKSVPATRQIRTAFFYRTQAWGNLDSSYGIFTIRSSSSDLVELRFNGIPNTLYLYAPTLQDSVSFSKAQWYHISIDAKIDSVSGWVKVYIDGVEAMSYVGNTGNSDIVTIWYGKTSGTAGGTYDLYYDDIYIDDTTGEASAIPVPIRRFYWLTPNANGNYADWEGSDGNKVDNYLLVDEKPPSDADYVKSFNTDEMDSYGVSTISIGANDIIEAIIPVARIQRYGVSEQVQIGTRLSSVDELGDAQTPVASYKYLSERQVTKPGGGAWDQSSLDDLEVVVKRST